MSSSLFLSAIAVVAITATTLTTLKYYPHKHDEEFNSYDDEFDLNYHRSPKFNNEISTDKPHEVVKRSSIEQYSIDDYNSSMIDEAKREKVKEV